MTNISSVAVLSLCFSQADTHGEIQEYVKNEDP